MSNIKPEDIAKEIEELDRVTTELNIKLGEGHQVAAIIEALEQFHKKRNKYPAVLPNYLYAIMVRKLDRGPEKWHGTLGSD
jgi:hypothetical protein